MNLVKMDIQNLDWEILRGKANAPARNRKTWTSFLEHRLHIRLILR